MFKNKVLPLLLSIVIAFALWSYVITFISSEREETFYDIPVAYQGEALLQERGLMVVTQEKPTVTLTLHGNRAELDKLDTGNITIIVDLSKIGEQGMHSLGYSLYYGDLPTNAFTVQSQYPGMVKVEVERRITKDVPVNVIYSGSVAEDYIADKENIELDYQMVNITGPASVIDKITQAVVDVDLEGKSDSFIESYRFTLCDAQGDPVDAKMVQANIAQVNLTLYIKRVKEIPLVVTVVDGGGATEETSQITIEPRTIKVAANENVLNDLNELNLGTINLDEFVTDSQKKMTITLPQGIENLSGKTEAVVDIKFPNLRSANMTITEFIPLNVPEGLEVEFITQELRIVVRGPKELVDKLKASDVSVTVDFADSQPGTYTFKVNVVMGEGFTKVGTLGPYRVSATLTEAEDKEGAK